MIREILINASDADDDDQYEPPSKVLNVAVIGGEAFLALHSYSESGKQSEEPLCAFRVRARSLLLALQAGMDDHDRLAGDGPE